MNRIEGLLTGLIESTQLIALYRDAEAISRQRERRDALHQQIASDWQTMYEALEAVISEQEYGNPDRIISPELEEEIRAILAAARGEM